MNALVEPTTIGLSEKTHLLLKRLKEDGHFAEMVDAYRFGIALALANSVDPPELPTPRTTIFNVNTLDPEKDIANAIVAIRGPSETATYRVAERLAEWGVKELSIRSEEGEIDLESILSESSTSE